MPYPDNPNGRSDKTRDDAQKTWENKMNAGKQFVPAEDDEDKKNLLDLIDDDEKLLANAGTGFDSYEKFKTPTTINREKTAMERSGHRVVGITKTGFTMSIRQTGSKAAEGMDTGVDLYDVIGKTVIDSIAVSVKNAAYRSNKLYLQNKYGFTRPIEVEIASCVKKVNNLGFGELKGSPVQMRHMLSKMKRKNKDFLTPADKELFKKLDALLNSKSLKSKRNYRKAKRTVTRKAMGMLRRCDAGIGMSLAIEIAKTIKAVFKAFYSAVMLGGGFRNHIRDQQIIHLQRKLETLQSKAANTPKTQKKISKIEHKKAKKVKKSKLYQEKRKRPRLRDHLSKFGTKLFAPVTNLRNRAFKKVMNSRLAQNKVSQVVINVFGKAGGLFGNVLSAGGTLVGMLFKVACLFAAMLFVVIIIIVIVSSILSSKDAAASDPAIRDAILDEISKLYSQQQKTIEEATSGYRYVNISNKDMRDADIYTLYPPSEDFYETTNAAEIMSLTLNRFNSDFATAGKKRVLEYVDALYAASHQVSITEYPYYDTNEDGEEILMYTDADIDITTYYFPYIYNCNSSMGNWSYPGQLLDGGMKFFAKTKGVVQGMCVAENYIVQSQNYNSSSCRVSVFNKSTGKKVNEQILSIGHGNSLTYNPKRKEILCAEDGRIHIMAFDPATGKLTYKSGMTIKGKGAGTYGIAYVESSNQYYLRSGSTIYYVSADANFKGIKKAFTYKRTIRGQGMCSDGKNIFICGGGDYQGVIYAYTPEGECYNTYKVNKVKELEEIDVDGEKMFIAAQGGNNPGIYYVTGQNSATTVSGGGLAKGSDTAEKIWNYFRSAGFTEEATAGILGNAERESSLNPGSHTAGTSYYGLWQLGPYFNFRETAKMKNVDWTKDVQFQCDYLLGQLKGRYKNLKWASSYSYTYNGKRSCSSEEFSKVTNVYDATHIFYCGFENSGHNSEINSKRYAFAKKWYEKFAGKAVTSSSTTSLSTSGIDYWIGGQMIRNMSSVGRGVYSITDDTAGYSWFKDSAEDSIREKIQMKSNAVFLISPGADAVVHNSDNYIREINRLVKNYPDATFYVLSVVPVDEEKLAQKGVTSITNSQIDAFNKKLKSTFKKQYLDVNSYIKNTGYITMSDGITYESGTTGRVYNWIYEKVK